MMRQILWYSLYCLLIYDWVRVYSNLKEYQKMLAMCKTIKHDRLCTAEKFSVQGHVYNYRNLTLWPEMQRRKIYSKHTREHRVLEDSISIQQPLT